MNNFSRAFSTTSGVIIALIAALACGVALVCGGCGFLMWLGDQGQADNRAPPPATPASDMLLHGHGSTVVSFVATPGLNHIECSSEAQGGQFAVWLLDARAQRLDVLATGAAPYHATKTVSLRAGTYNLEIESAGPWQVVIHPPEPRKFRP